MILVTALENLGRLELKTHMTASKEVILLTRKSFLYRFSISHVNDKQENLGNSSVMVASWIRLNYKIEF